MNTLFGRKARTDATRRATGDGRRATGNGQRSTVEAHLRTHAAVTLCAHSCRKPNNGHTLSLSPC